MAQTAVQVLGNGFQMKKNFQEIGKNFEYGSTSQSQFIKDIDREIKYLFASKHFSKKTLGMFQAIKREVLKNIKKFKITVPPKKESLYYKIRQFESLESGEYYEYKNVYELDVNKAYYVALKNLQYISDEFFNKCLDQPKSVRLALVGSLATMKLIQRYEKGKIINEVPEIITNEITRSVFFQVVKFIDDILFNFSQNRQDHFLFYWVDGIFFEDYGIEKINEDLFYFSSMYDVDFSVKKWDLLRFYKTKNDKIIVKMKDSKGWKMYNVSN